MHRKLMLFLIVAGCLVSLSAFSKSVTDTVKVLGKCESCKAGIEKAALTAGALKADWSEKTSVLTVDYDDANTSLLAIEKQIAFAGHDTRDVKATVQAYDKLSNCCKYNRTGMSAAKVCDKDEKDTKQ